MTREELETIIADAVAKDRHDLNLGKNLAIARAALSAIESAGVTLCPNEPTEEMDDAGYEAIRGVRRGICGTVPGGGRRMSKFTVFQLEDDVQFLACRASAAGSFGWDEERDSGISSNSLVGLAYGIGEQKMPSDRSDYAACVRAVRKLPRHRRTKNILSALKKAKLHFLSRYPMYGSDRRRALKEMAS